MGEMLPVAAFDTAALPPRARFDAWRSLISAVFEPSPPPGQEGRDMRAQARSVHFGQALLVEAAAQSQHFTRSRRLVAVGGLDHYMIQVYRRGTCEGAYGEVLNRVRPGDIKLIDLARPFHSLNSDFDNITLTIPRSALAPLLAHPDGLHGRVLPREDPMAQVIGAHIHALSDAAADMTAAQGAGIAAATLRLMAACLGVHARARDEARPYRAAALGQSVRAFIDQHIASPMLDAETLAQRFHVSRRQMYRLFAAEGGVGAYVQSRRLQRCLQALTDPLQAERGIGEIALGLGFTSDAHFSRSFRRNFGITPSEARAGHHLARPAGHERSSTIGCAICTAACTTSQPISRDGSATRIERVCAPRRRARRPAAIWHTGSRYLARPVKETTSIKIETGLFRGNHVPAERRTTDRPDCANSGQASSQGR